MALRLQPMAEHVGHKFEIRVLTDWAQGRSVCANVLGRTNEFRVRVTNRLGSYSTLLHLADQHAPRQPMIDNASRPTVRTSKSASGEPHRT